MSYHPDYLRQLIATTLHLMDMYSPVAAELLLMTAAHESKLGRWNKQIGGGPALGIYQMESATLKDIYSSYLTFRQERLALVDQLTNTLGPDPVKLQHDLIYATVMARLHYRRVDEPFPQPGNLLALACYAKNFWNTSNGKATAEDYMQAYQETVIM